MPACKQLKAPKFLRCSNSVKEVGNQSDSVAPKFLRRSHSAKEVGNQSDNVAPKFLRRSNSAKVLPEVRNQIDSLALFNRNEIVQGELLGSGAFSNVYDVSGIKLRKWHVVQKERRECQQAKKDALENGDAGFAIKHLKPSVLKGRRNKLAAAVRCLIDEAKLLALLSHENIIKLHGVPSFDCDDISSGKHNDYFLVMEKLDSTMDKIIDDWKMMGVKAIQGGTMRVVKTNYALQLANALSYMHKSRIIYRDLKPQNIGVQDHTIKLFDFGISRALPSREDTSVCEHDDECFLMSLAGTPRYTAPEVFTTGNYGLKADVYSWSMVYYEMLTLTKPFIKCDQQDLSEFIRLGKRPEIESDMGIPCAIEDILQRSWKNSISERPAMKDLCRELERLLNGTSLHCTVYNKSKDVLSSDNKSSNCSSFVARNSPEPTQRRKRVAAMAA